MGLGGDPGGATAPSLDGRSFTAASVDGPGQVDGDTVFHYHEDAGVIWADYAGGEAVRGSLVAGALVAPLVAAAMAWAGSSAAQGFRG